MQAHTDLGCRGRWGRRRLEAWLVEGHAREEAGRVHGVLEEVVPAQEVAKVERLSHGKAGLRGMREGKSDNGWRGSIDVCGCCSLQYW